MVFLILVWITSLYSAHNDFGNSTAEDLNTLPEKYFFLYKPSKEQ